jgi:P22 coat protein - gene protein 5
MAESNNLLATAEITYEAAARLKNRLKYAMMINRQYSSKFANEGAQRGDTISVRMPVRYIVQDGPVAVPQPIRETYKDLTLNYQKTLAATWTSKDRTLSMENFAERYLDPAVEAVANEVDRILLLDAYSQVYNLKGTPGARPNDSQLFLDAQARMLNQSTPMDRPWQALLSPLSSASMVKALQGLFHDGPSIAGNYRRGRMQSEQLGYDFDITQNMPTHVVGALGGTPQVTTAGQTGSSINTSGWTATTGALRRGDVFTIAGVFEINPMSRQSTTELQQFTARANATADAGGLMTILIDPPITPPNSDGTPTQYQTVTAAPGAGALLTIVGAAGTTSQQNLCFHPDYHTVGFADLALPAEGAGRAYRIQDSDTGLAFRVWEGSDWTTDRHGFRIDFLFGSLVIYPQWACRVAA